MALWQWVMFWFLAPAAALATDLRPAEPPPGDFAARQYIDSRGCVFLRDDRGIWNARLARDGTPICGYPPSLSQRGLDGKPRLRVLDPDAGKTRAELASEALERVVTTQLHDGELASDPRPLQVLPDMGPEPHSTQPMDELKAALRAAPAVRQGMSRDLQPNRRLCELLGYDGKVAAKTPAAGDEAVGQDPTKGYCASLPDTDLSRLAFARPIGSAKADSKPTASVAAPVVPSVPARPDRAVAKPATRTAAAQAPAPQKNVAPTPAAPRSAPAQAPAAAAALSIGMIPAGARYVQIGLYRDAPSAERAAQRAIALGYPVVRGRERGQSGQGQMIMAGPFDNREAIVRALDALRKAGFRNALPR